ncbi:hypothetical protein [Roseofilum capinflatum]|uniref:Uncharacterized protein n=1 Tax=Roseofilum capinflatum BLCC-M114 TaxID=3022440 RepID=A0ABT7B6U4_9CYAN|nr:hypothetical protein [Roseofilum capinflatum]MDJ1174887.1 hypothetical protein [Roseofilum capinflatum BLCC-M114]
MPISAKRSTTLLNSDSKLSGLNKDEAGYCSGVIDNYRFRYWSTGGLFKSRLKYGFYEVTIKCEKENNEFINVICRLLNLNGTNLDKFSDLTDFLYALGCFDKPAGESPIKDYRIDELFNYVIGSTIRFKLKRGADGDNILDSESVLLVSRDDTKQRPLKHGIADFNPLSYRLDEEGFYTAKVTDSRFKRAGKRYNPATREEFKVPDQVIIDFSVLREGGFYKSVSSCYTLYLNDVKLYTFDEYVEDEDGMLVSEDEGVLLSELNLVGKNFKFKRYERYSSDNSFRVDFNSIVWLDVELPEPKDKPVKPLPFPDVKHTTLSLSSSNLLALNSGLFSQELGVKKMPTSFKYREKVLNEIKRQEGYKSLLKTLPLARINYRKLDDYFDFDKFKEDFIFYYYAQESGGFDIPERIADEDLASLRFGLNAIVAGECKFLWLKDDLLEALRHTEKPPVAEIEQVAPVICLFTPKDSFSAYSIRYIKIFTTKMDSNEYASAFREDNIALFPSPVYPESVKKSILATTIRIYTTTYDFFTTFRVIDGILDRGGEQIETGIEYEENDKAFIDEVNDLCFNFLLYLSTKPEIIEAEPREATKVSGKGFGKSEKRLLEPQMVGADYKQSIESKRTPGGGTHASPRTHWRMGHWRRVAIGAGRVERSWRWIKPVLVNPPEA